MQRTREAFADAFDALGDGAGRLSSLLSSFEGLSGGADEFRNEVVRIAGAFDAASQTFSTIKNFQTWFQEAKTSALAFNSALKASETTAGGLKAAIAAIGGPWTLIDGAIAAAAAAFVVFNATAKETDEPKGAASRLYTKAHSKCLLRTFGALSKRRPGAKARGSSLGGPNPRGSGQSICRGVYYIPYRFLTYDAFRAYDEMVKRWYAIQLHRTRQ